MFYKEKWLRLKAMQRAFAKSAGPGPRCPPRQRNCSVGMPGGFPAPSPFHLMLRSPVRRAGNGWGGRCLCRPRRPRPPKMNTTENRCLCRPRRPRSPYMYLCRTPNRISERIPALVHSYACDAWYPVGGLYRYGAWCGAWCPLFACHPRDNGFLPSAGKRVHYP